MSAKLPLPRQIFGHGFMTMNGQRMSKSLGTIIDPIVAADRLRPGAGSAAPVSGQGNRVSAATATSRGNATTSATTSTSRTISGTSSAAYRRWRSAIAGGRLAPTGAGVRSARAASASRSWPTTAASMDAFALHEGAAAAFRLIDATNEFIAATAPWTLAKDPAQADRLTQVLFDAAEAIRLAAVLLEPIMPSSSREILRRVGAPARRTQLRPRRPLAQRRRACARTGRTPLAAARSRSLVERRDPERRRSILQRAGAAAPAPRHLARTAPGTAAPSTAGTRPAPTIASPSTTS